MNKNFSSGAFALAILFLILGCNLSDYVQTTPATNSDQAVVKSNSNKSTIESAADTVLNTEKTGIPECDEALTLIEQQMQNDPDQTIPEQIARQGAKNLIYSLVRGELANVSQEKKAEIAKRCKQIADNLNAVQ